MLAVAPRCRWRKQVCAANNDHSPMTRSQLESLLLRGEATDLDWKRDFPLGLASGSGNPDWEKGRGELLKDIAAIANSLVAGEGHLVLGVRDEGSRRIVVGRSGRWDDADFQTWASNTFDVAPQFRYVEVSWNSEATVGIFIVHTNPGYPHLPKISVGGVLHRGQVWMRRGTQNGVALTNDLRQMIRGDKPITDGRTTGPIVTDASNYYRALGLEPVLPRWIDREAKLRQGFTYAYEPGTRRQVVVVTSNGVPDLVLMLRPPE